MKLTRRLVRICACMCAALMFVSCNEKPEPTEPVEKPEENTGNENGDNTGNDDSGNTDDNGGNTGGGNADVKNDFEHVYVVNKGDLYGIGSDNYIIYLTKGDIDPSTTAGDGDLLLFDLNATAGTSSLPTGQYSALLEDPAPGQSQDFTFLPGSEYGEWIFGSFLLSQNGDSREFKLIENGTLKVSREEKEYLFEAEIVLNGQSQSYVYKGVIEDFPTSDQPGDKYTTINCNFTNCYGYEYQGAWHEAGYTWTLYFTGKDIDAKTMEGGLGYVMEVDFISDVAGELTPGVYEVLNIMDITSSDVIVAGSLMPGILSDSTPYGCWLLEKISQTKIQAVFGATSGYAIVDLKDDGTYEIEFDFIDDEYVGHYYGSYKGKPTLDIQTNEETTNSSLNSTKGNITFHKVGDKKGAAPFNRKRLIRK